MGADGRYVNTNGRGSGGETRRNYDAKQRRNSLRYDGELPTQTRGNKTPSSMSGELSIVVALLIQILNLGRKI